MPIKTIGSNQSMPIKLLRTHLGIIS